MALILSLALAQHPAFVQVDRIRLARFGEPHLWGEPAILAAARGLKADVALYGKIQRDSGALVVQPRYVELQSGGGEGKTLEVLTVPEGELLDRLPVIPLAYLRAFRISLSDDEVARIRKVARPTPSLSAFEAFVRGELAALKETTLLIAAPAELPGSLVSRTHAMLGGRC